MDSSNDGEKKEKRPRRSRANTNIPEEKKEDKAKLLAVNAPNTFSDAINVKSKNHVVDSL